MRTVYTCLHCAAHYMPPESMRYETIGRDASPIHCENPDCREVISGQAVIGGLPRRVLERWALARAAQQAEPRVPRPGRARGTRPATNAGARRRVA